MANDWTCLKCCRPLPVNSPIGSRKHRRYMQLLHDWCNRPDTPLARDRIHGLRIKTALPYLCSRCVKELGLEHRKVRGRIQAKPAPTYDDFLRSEYWQRVRLAKFEQAGRECHRCGATTNLHVHHLTYEHNWRELDYLDDLRVLCFTCHSAAHPDKTLVRSG